MQYILNVMQVFIRALNLKPDRCCYQGSDEWWYPTVTPASVMTKIQCRLNTCLLAREGPAATTQLICP